MFTPQLIVGTLVVRSMHDPAVDLAALSARPDWASKHVESVGTGELPAKAGERLSEFVIRILRPAEAASVDAKGTPAQMALAWYVRTIVSMDEVTDRKVLLEELPLAVMVEVGSYARRSNCEVSRPFSNGSLRPPSSSVDGSTDSRPKPRRAGGRSTVT